MAENDNHVEEITGQFKKFLKVVLENNIVLTHDCKLFCFKYSNEADSTVLVSDSSRFDRTINDRSDNISSVLPVIADAAP